MRKYHISAVSRAGSALLLLVCLILAGCAGLERQVPAEDRIFFSARETGDGVLNRWPLTVSYSYRLRGKSLELEGDARYGRYVDFLNVYVMFIDGSGNVLQREIVYFSGYRSDIWPGPSFQAKLEVPDGAKGFTFDYSAHERTPRR
jgi:hypothetical protein